MLTTATSTPGPSFQEGHRRARRDRNLLIHTLLRHSARGIARGMHGLARKARGAALSLTEEWYRRRAIRALHQLDDRMLADIGLGRGDIENVVRCGSPRRPA